MTMECTVGKYPAALVLYFLCMGLWYPVIANETLNVTVIAKGDLGKTANLTCIIEPVTKTDPADIQWQFEGQPLNMSLVNQTLKQENLPFNDYGGIRQANISSIILRNVSYSHEGNYTCLAKSKYSRNVTLDLRFEGNVVEDPDQNSEFHVNVTNRDNINLKCMFKVYKPFNVIWYKKPDIQQTTELSEPQTVCDYAKPKSINITHVQSTCVLPIRSHEDNGSYFCQMEDTVASKNLTGPTISVKVYGHPHVTIDKLIPISSTEIYLKWTVHTYNSPITSYVLKFYAESDIDRGFSLYNNASNRISVNSTSFVMKVDNKSTTYTIKLEVQTKFGSSTSTPKNVTTLDKDPVFVPQISINGFSATSVTIGWSPPKEDIAHLIHFYKVEARNKHDNTSYYAVHQRDGKNLPYMFQKLEPHSTYYFKVCACSEYTNSCGEWSKELEAATLDGVPGEPSNVLIYCDVDFLNITWNQPTKPNAEIKGYTMEVTGLARYKDRYGQLKNATWGPFSKFMSNETFGTRVDELPPNTKFSVRLSAVTRTRRRGDEVQRNCSTRHARPHAPPRPRWRKIREEDDTYKFKVYLPRITERNGPICCYRVYMVRLPPQMDWKTLPPPQEIDVSDYKEVHANPTLGAYITDIFSNDRFPADSELLLGDGDTKFDSTEPIFTSNPNCSRCLEKPKRIKEKTIAIATTSTTTEASQDDEDEEEETTLDPVEEPKTRRRRNLEDYSKMAMMADPSSDSKVTVTDGPLDPKSNYSLFVEVISEADNESMFSDLTIALMPAPSPPVVVPSSMMEIALQITCAIAAVILLLMIIFCIMQTRRTRKMPPQAQIEMHDPFNAIKRYWDSLRGQSALSVRVPADVAPVPRDQLAHAYAARQQDSDYGFQKEFEWLQLLPECFTDRTTHASEARENQSKNRYPDIKAYDQTRVKLSQIDSINGSDYINANFVMGYQERKKFICAQGPTDTTVNDFWRMIWEYGLELIVMLTNLEEYSKVKCSKYWPDERFSKVFGSIQVTHVGEKRYSDYIVRELKITKQATNADGQPIVENGVAKRNGDIKDGSESSAPTSPRETKESGETRIVRQYHFLMWKDFAAPEHPHSILKFIKRVNEAWAGMLGRAVVVHCSAGVGRTGTLVALDCLLEQLRATGQVSVYNTVAELRKQRNFLVQSLKQYVFVYRALVEYAHFGDTEISAGRLRPATDRLRNTPEGSDKCLMEIEFEKIMTCPIAEPVKSTGAGAGEELRARNRSPECLPYDRNRVILTPMPGKDYSTYINASFIQAYDNSEGFIITQDPLPNTILDFWRMVSEHNVTTIVMLSELGDGKCPRYWDDGTVQYEHISVQYEESESCPYYTRRQFRISNDKNGEISCVRQLQYQGWPTARGHVPEVTRGLAELADAAGPAPSGTMLVHCQFGTERSPLFVALCILISQLRVERRVDVSAVARAVRSQRARTIDTFTQYEFLYRAILNYAELHNLLEDS